MRLKNSVSEKSVANILISLTGISADPNSTKSNSANGEQANDNNFSSASEQTTKTIEHLRHQVAAMLSDDEELEINKALLLRDKSVCTASELEMIRRERNRMHAKKTRLRKKKMLQEMEAVSNILNIFIFMHSLIYLFINFYYIDCY
jgi:hypothetical protein